MFYACVRRFEYDIYCAKKIRGRKETRSSYLLPPPIVFLSTWSSGEILTCPHQPPPTTTATAASVHRRPVLHGLIRPRLETARTICWQQLCGFVCSSYICCIKKSSLIYVRAACSCEEENASSAST